LVPLTNFKRTIAITTVVGKPNLKQVVITIDYTAGRWTRQYVLTTYVSSF
jgi:hypothetical protein